MAVCAIHASPHSVAKFKQVYAGISGGSFVLPAQINVRQASYQTRCRLIILNAGRIIQKFSA
jgi:hypothetical protein